MCCEYARDIYLSRNVFEWAEDRCTRSGGNTCLHTNTSAVIDTPRGRITFTSKYTCVSENLVYAIKCHARHKIYIEENW